MLNPGSDQQLPDFTAIQAAAERIAAHVRQTPVLEWSGLGDEIGCRIFLKCEHEQASGAFKLRGALNAVWSLPDVDAALGVVTHSSGNHGAALAMAAGTRGIPAHVVVPRGSARSKLENIRRNGGIVHVCEATLAAREAMAAQVRAETGAQFIHPYTDGRVIAGQGTLVPELLSQCGELDAVLTPVGGGGLASGCAIAAHALHPDMRMFAAEPEGAADAFLSLREGRRVTDVVPDTVCDGLRAGIGEINFQCLRSHKVQVLPVSDDEAVAAMQRIHRELHQLIEPSSATVIAALLRYRHHFAGLRVGVVLTGGNVDRDAWPWLDAGNPI